MFLLQENQSIASTFAMSRLQMRVCCGQMRWEGFKWGEHNTREVFRKMHICNFFMILWSWHCNAFEKVPKKNMQWQWFEHKWGVFGNICQENANIQILNGGRRLVQTNWLLLKDCYWERRSEEAKQAHYGSLRALLTLALPVGSAISNYLSREKLEKVRCSICDAYSIRQLSNFKKTNWLQRCFFL